MAKVSIREISKRGVFTLIFKNQDLLKDFEDMVAMFNKTTEQIKVKDMGSNTYEVRRVEEYAECWELTMHKYLSYSKDTKNGKKCEAVIFTMLRMISVEAV